MYEAAENIAESNQTIFGTTALKRLAKDNPNLMTALKWGSLFGAGGLAF